MKRVVALASALAVCIACRDQHPITSPLRSSADFSDGRIPGGNPHFFFLPPLVKQPSFSGTFNPALRPVVEICQLDVDINDIPIACSATVPTINPGIVELDLVDELYQVNWNTLLPPIDVTKFYRIQVRVATGGTILGFADVDPVLNGTELKNVNTGEFIGLVDGRTLPIKFRIEIGTTCKTTDCFEGTVGAAGGTFITSSGLAGTFFPAGALNQDVFLVIDRLDGRPCVPIDLPQFSGSYSIFGWALPATIGANDGDNQTAVASSAVTTAPSVVLRDSSGTPVAGATVTFAVASGDGAVTNPVAVTGSDGIARVGSWTL